MFNFLAKCFLYINIFANTWIKNAHFNPFCQYMFLLTKVKQAFKLMRHKKEIGVTFCCDFPIRYVNGCPESKIMSVKYPHLQLLIQTSQFYMGSWHKLLKNKHLFL